MTTKGDLCQKSRDPVTTITGIWASIVMVIPTGRAVEHHLRSARNRNLAEDLGNRGMLVRRLGLSAEFCA